MIAAMAIERVTVSLPAELRQAAQELAKGQGVPFSTLVSSALERHLRGLLLDRWLQDYQDELGAFTEEELRAAAERMGLPYTPEPVGPLATAGDPSPRDDLSPRDERAAS